MLKYTLKFLGITALTSVLYFFTIGTVVGFFFTEGSVNLPLSLIFMVLNLVFFIKIWQAALKSPKVFHPDMRLPYTVLEMNIPAVVYAVLTVLLLIGHFLLGQSPVALFLPAIEYGFLTVSPLGMNTVMLLAIADELWPLYDNELHYNELLYMAEYFLGNLLHILIYTAVITVTCRRVQRDAKEKTGKQIDHGTSSERYI